jgi:hypothetical protein
LGRRTTLATGAGLMIASGVTFATSSEYWVLLLASVLGVISPSGKEIGPFRAIEESTIAQLTPANQRSDIYAWYKLIGTAGEACGTIICGFVVQYLQSLKGWDKVSSYRVVFLAYTGLGLLNLLLACCLSFEVEAGTDAHPQPGESEEEASETSPLLQEEPSKALSDATREVQPSRWFLPRISKKSRPLILTLCLLFAFDSFASGLVPSYGAALPSMSSNTNFLFDRSLVTYFFYRKFSIEPGSLGSIFFAAAVISSLSALAASSLSRRIGLVRTMVFTHLPSAIFLALIPVPSSLPLAVVFVLLRSCTKSMDDVPRAAFLAGIIKPAERTAIMGLVSVLKMMAQSAGPLITGVLAGKGYFWVGFVVAGGIKITYDLTFFGMFRGYEKSKLNRQKDVSEPVEVLESPSLAS